MFFARLLANERSTSVAGNVFLLLGCKARRGTVEGIAGGWAGRLNAIARLRTRIGEIGDVVLGSRAAVRCQCVSGLWARVEDVLGQWTWLLIQGVA